MANKIDKDTEQIEPPSADEAKTAAGQEVSGDALARVRDIQATTEDAEHAEHIETVVSQDNGDDMENKDEEKIKQKSAPRAKRRNNR